MGLESNNVGNDSKIDAAINREEVKETEDDFESGDQKTTEKIDVTEEKKEIAAVKCENIGRTPESVVLNNNMLQQQTDNSMAIPNIDECFGVQAKLKHTRSNKEDSQKEQAEQMTSKQPGNDMSDVEEGAVYSHSKHKTMIPNEIKQKPDSSEDSPIWKKLCDIKPVRHINAQHFSRSLCNVTSEKSEQDFGEENDVRRGSTGTMISGTLQTMSSKPKDDAYELSVASIRDEHRSNGGNVSPGTSSRSAHTGHTWGASVTTQRFTTSDGTARQLQREKKTPRHIRKVSSLVRDLCLLSNTLYFIYTFLLLIIGILLTQPTNSQLNSRHSTSGICTWCKFTKDSIKSKYSHLQP